MACLVGPTSTPVIKGSLLMASAKGSIARMNKRSEIRQPYLEPHSAANTGGFGPFIMTENENEEQWADKKRDIHFIKFLLRLYFERTFR